MAVEEECREDKKVVERLPWEALGPALFVILGMVLMLIVALFPETLIKDLSLLLMGAVITRIRRVGTGEEDTGK